MKREFNFNDYVGPDLFTRSYGVCSNVVYLVLYQPDIIWLFVLFHIDLSSFYKDIGNIFLSALFTVTTLEKILCNTTEVSSYAIIIICQ